MILFEEALKIVLEQQVTTIPARVPLSASVGRILAEDIHSDIDMPPFNKSAVDGFACRMEDLKASVLTVTETIPAGKVPSKTVLTGTCAKIMTGAMVPPGADCVVMVEFAEETGENTVSFSAETTNVNICFKGEDIKTGDLVIAVGSRIKPSDIAVLASVGCVNPLVAALPIVGIISTGDELVEPADKPGDGQIRNSNAWQLEAQVRQVPAIPQYFGIAKDNAGDLRNTIEKALKTCDMVLLTGGVSMGDFDFVPQIMQEAGIEILFKSVAIQPGKPTVFGRRANQFIFGLPGNPVSSFVLFEILVRPFIFNMMGHEYHPHQLLLPLGQDFSRRRSERKSLIPVNVIDGHVVPADYHGSAHINAYTHAEAVMILEIGVTEVKKGEPVNVRLL